jgi:hypothetical protein
LAPGSRTTQSSSRWWWYWLDSMPPGSTVMIFTVQGTLWAYCSNLPQGFSTFTEGGLLSAKRLSSPMTGQFKPFVPFMGGRNGPPALGARAGAATMVRCAVGFFGRRQLLFADGYCSPTANGYFRRRDAYQGLRSRGLTRSTWKTESGWSWR